jgi:hypothetical protein
MIITIPLTPRYITAAALANKAGATGAVTAATVMNASYQMTAVAITIQPGSGYVFSAVAGACNVTYDFGGPYTTWNGNVCDNQWESGSYGSA